MRMMSRRLSISLSMLVVTLISASTIAFPIANAQSTVMVSIPKGSGVPNTPGYAPLKVTVVIGVNNSVTWKNADTAHHTVTSITGNGSLNSGDMGPNATYSFTFTTPGTYNYTCTYHKWMLGLVVVEAAATSTTTTHTSTTPEFPAAYLGVILFAVIAVSAVAATRLRKSDKAASLVGRPPRS